MAGSRGLGLGERGSARERKGLFGVVLGNRRRRLSVVASPVAVEGHSQKVTAPPAHGDAGAPAAAARESEARDDDAWDVEFDADDENFLDAKKRMNAGDRFLAAADGRWWRKGFNNVQRYVETWRFVAGLVRMELRAARAKSQRETRRLRGRAARYCRRGLLQLGPTFIKAGQVLSTRVDVVPEEYIRELSTLQDDVPVSTTSGEYARRVIKRELGKDVKELFSHFEEVPFACASLGQVHRARDSAGREVAIKVQRAGIAKLLEVDLKTLRLFARLANKFDPNADGAKRDWVALCEQSAAVLLEECDYRLEARNAMAFSRNFEGIDWVRVPEVVPELSSRRVLTMEYIPGIKISSIQQLETSGVDPKWCAERVSDAYLLQLCKHGFFHCDPHPGNIAVLPPRPKPDAADADADAAPAASAGAMAVGGNGTLALPAMDASGAMYSESGRPAIVWYDFGMVRALGRDMRNNIVDLVVSIYDNDPKLATETLYRLNAVVPGTEPSSLRRFATICLKDFTDTLNSNAKWFNQGSEEDKRKELRKRRAKIGADLLTFGSETPLVVPPSFALIFRALTTLDGLGKTLDKDYDLTRLSKPFIRDLVVEKNGGALSYAGERVLKQLGLRPVDIGNFLQAPRKLAQVDDFCKRLESGDAVLQVRALEAELALQRIEAVQKATMHLVFGATALNAGLLLSSLRAAKVLAGTATVGTGVLHVIKTALSPRVLMFAAAAVSFGIALKALWRLNRVLKRQKKVGLVNDGSD